MMRLTNLLLFFLPFSVLAQNNDYNLSGNYAAEGYDVVAYFSGKAKKGDSKYTVEYDGVMYKFSNQENLDTFKKSPLKYMPQYGGWCAYAMGTSGDKVSVDPKTFEVRDGKLYLFYNAFFTNTWEKWKAEGPEALREKADMNWEKIRSNN